MGLGKSKPSFTEEKSAADDNEIMSYCGRIGS